MRRKRKEEEEEQEVKKRLVVLVSLRAIGGDDGLDDEFLGLVRPKIPAKENNEIIFNM